MIEFVFLFLVVLASIGVARMYPEKTKKWVQRATTSILLIYSIIGLVVVYVYVQTGIWGLLAGSAIAAFIALRTGAERGWY